MRKFIKENGFKIIILIILGIIAISIISIAYYFVIFLPQKQSAISEKQLECKSSAKNLAHQQVIEDGKQMANDSQEFCSHYSATGSDAFPLSISDATDPDKASKLVHDYNSTVCLNKKAETNLVILQEEEKKLYEQFYEQCLLE